MRVIARISRPRSAGTVTDRARARLVVAGAILLAACGGAPASPSPGTDDAHGRLPTGARLDPAGTTIAAGNLPLAMALSPDRRYAVLLLNGFTTRGIQVVDRASGHLTQTATLPGAFLGIAFAPDGRTLAVSGGNADAIYLFAWHDGTATLADSILLVAKREESGVRYPSGLAWSRDGNMLYVAENLADSVAVIDVHAKRVLQRFATGLYPYGVAVAADGSVYVSAWGGNAVATFTKAAGGALQPTGRIPAGRHPSAMTLNADGTRLFVASASTDRILVIDTRARAVIKEMRDPPPAGPGEGSTPNALALSDDGTRLFVAEADANAAGVIDLSARTSGVARASGHDALIARIPVGWYPAAIATLGDTLLVVNAKGRGTVPNPLGPNGNRPYDAAGNNYTLAQLMGSLTTITGSRGDSAALAPLTARVAAANGWDLPARTAAHYPPFEHVIYVIKENRTFDQVLSDVRGVDGDTTLLFFTRTIGPNHHALAERFGAYDRFFVNAEVSADGHNWSDAAYAADYVEKTVSLNYAGQGRDYDYEGANRGEVPDDDVNEPASGYLWNTAARAGITYRDYGEFTYFDSTKHEYRPTKRVLEGHVNAAYPSFGFEHTDQQRMDVFLSDLREFERTGQMPALITMHLPNDHTMGLRAGALSPRATFADNDLALGRLVAAVSRSRFWKNTLIITVEDDAQNGPDHVDSHRSVALVISAYSRPGVVHRFTNTTDLLATIVEVLHLGSLSQFDFYGRPLREVFADVADTTPYAARVPGVDPHEVNPRVTGQVIPGRSARPLDLSDVDRADENDFNRELWFAFKGTRPYPAARRMSLAEPARAR